MRAAFAPGHQLPDLQGISTEEPQERFDGFQLLPGPLPDVGFHRKAVPALDKEGEGMVDPHAVSAVVQRRRAVTEPCVRTIGNQVPAEEDVLRCQFSAPSRESPDPRRSFLRARDMFALERAPICWPKFLWKPASTQDEPAKPYSWTSSVTSGWSLVVECVEGGHFWGEEGEVVPVQVHSPCISALPLFRTIGVDLWDEVEVHVVRESP